MVVGGELFEMNRRAAHPHMNNLVYGRRSAPSTASDAVVIRSIMTICVAIYSNIRARCEWGHGLKGYKAQAVELKGSCTVFQTVWSNFEVRLLQIS